MRFFQLGKACEAEHKRCQINQEIELRQHDVERSVQCCDYQNDSKMPMRRLPRLRAYKVQPLP